MIELDANANESEVDVPVGQTITLTLPENRTTGHRWQVTAGGEPVCTLSKEEFQAAGNRPGQGGSHTWQFRVEQPGTAAIKLIYGRSWDTNAEPAQTFIVYIRGTER